ncbi:MAG: hypothetical protein J5379_09410 [Clostridiales bacterium]|nr:hypothetical protein [Clostridiales bacterium]
MGTWNASITGNDTAQDLLDEYKAAFFYYDVPTAVSKIDQYVRTMFDESDEEEWCDYFYSLAEFMWKKGILTDEIKKRAIEMVDSDFGMEEWIAAGTSEEKKRRNVLAKFRNMITSPQCAPKKIKLDLHMEDIFEDGEYVAFRLQTKGKTYVTSEESAKRLSEEEFLSYDGRYVVVQKIRSKVTYVSSIVPEVCDRWAVFRMFDGTYDSPDEIDIHQLKEISFNRCPCFSTAGSMFYFKKRNYKIIGKGPVPEEVPEKSVTILSFGISHASYDPDSNLIDNLYPFEIEILPFQWDPEIVDGMIREHTQRENGYGYGLKKDKYEKYREKMKKLIPERQAEFRDLLEKGAKVCAIRHKVLMGVGIKAPGRKPILYMRSKDPSYEKELSRYMKRLSRDE